MLAIQNLGRIVVIITIPVFSSCDIGEKFKSNECTPSAPVSTVTELNRTDCSIINKYIGKVKKNIFDFYKNNEGNTLLYGDIKITDVHYISSSTGIQRYYIFSSNVKIADGRMLSQTVRRDIFGNIILLDVEPID